MADVTPPSMVFINKKNEVVEVPAISEGMPPLVLPIGGQLTLPHAEAEKYDYKKGAEAKDLEARTEGSAEQKETSDVGTNIFVLLFWGFVALVSLRSQFPGVRDLWYWGGPAVVGLIVIGISLLFGYKGPAWMIEKTNATLMQTSTVAIGIGLPVLVIYLFAEPNELARTSGRWPLLLLCRALQLALIAVASLLPAFLYFLFDRQKVATLREDFNDAIRRFTPGVREQQQAMRRYGRRFVEIYGPDEKDGVQRSGQGTRFPILVTTFLTTIGWTLVLLPVDRLPADMKPDEVYTFLTPKLTALNFGFLGVYFFSITMIFFRYVRADLKPKTYSYITVRMLCAMILVWLVATFPSNWLSGSSTGRTPASVSLLGVSFLCGLFTDQALKWTQVLLGKWSGFRVGREQEALALRQLDGITPYYEAQLQEEGIENIQNLVHHDLIDLMLQTRIPVRMIVDWVDQGILFLHVNDSMGADDSDKTKLQGRTAHQKTWMELRSKGIRTATDLQRAYRHAKNRNESGPFERILGTSDGVRRLRVIMDSLDDDEWLNNIRHWHDRAVSPASESNAVKPTEADTVTPAEAGAAPLLPPVSPAPEAVVTSRPLRQHARASTQADTDRQPTLPNKAEDERGEEEAVREGKISS